MKLVIVTGMSGAGKTIALKALEDMGFYCVDNLPIPLMEPFARLASQQSQSGRSQVALGIDIRSGEELPQLKKVLADWRQAGLPYEVLFLDASDKTLVKRYRETRRNHPLSGHGRVDAGIRLERERLGFLRDCADYIIDTSQLLAKELRQELEKIFAGESGYQNLFVTVLSFGFKYGLPADADLVFDVRFLPNPFYEDDLRPRTGLEQSVRDYVYQGGTAEAFLMKLYDMIGFLIPNYVLEGKNQLVIAIGCTGGRHRSVAIATALYTWLSKQQGIGLKVEHRDIERDKAQK